MYESPDIINRVGELLRSPLPLPAETAPYVIELDAVLLPLAEAVRTTLIKLYEKRKQALWPKDVPINGKEITEIERQVRLNGDLAPLEADYLFLIRLEKLIEQRINLAAMIRST